MVTILLISAAVLAAVVIFFPLQVKFGARPSGERLARAMASPNYRNGEFRNLVERPSFTNGASSFSIGWRFLFCSQERAAPTFPLPARKTDLRTFPPGENVLVWLGHSSCFTRLNGISLLVDPHCGPNASPLPFTTHAFPGTLQYKPEDLPAADYVLLTHDHWDHLDYPTILSLKGKAKRFICGLGVGAHLERWGIPPDRIGETDWNDVTALGDGITLHTLTAHHFSGRGLTRNQGLWVSFLLESPGYKLYFSGDGGYGTHFADIGGRFGPIDLAVMENGQYNENWRYNHMLPEESVQAARDLRARAVMPVHSGKFVLAHHPWDEPLRRFTAAPGLDGMRLVTPVIGEAVRLDDAMQAFCRWWEGLE